MKKNLPLIAAIFAACMISACGDDDNKNEGTQQPSNGTKIVENNLALCSDGIDNDDNNLADCDDSGCAGFIFCQNPDPNKETSPKTCADGTDNDNNGKRDCEESTCTSFTICKTAAWITTAMARKTATIRNAKNSARGQSPIQKIPMNCATTRRTTTATT